jgi:hypothetical protein
MKNVTVCLAALLTIGLVNPTLAGRPGKANILHCGCAVDVDGNFGMAYVDVNVSSKARGHTKHGNGTIDSCFVGNDADGTGTMVDFLRTADDCHIAGQQLAGAGLMLCASDDDDVDDVMAGDPCGEPAPES